MEKYFGAFAKVSMIIKTYLSQNSKSVIVNDQVAEITVYDNKGNARSVYGSMLTLGSKK
mgnify:CR=1